MSTKRFFLALALTVISFDGAVNAANSWSSIFNPAPFAWDFIECAGGGNETFSNLGANSTSYSTRTWMGDNGVAWSAADSRTDQTLNGKALAIRTGTFTNTSVITGGIGTLSFNYKRVFTGNSTLKVFVNGIQYGGDITVSADTTTAFSQVINVSGNVTIELRNSGGNRTIIDDLAWTCNDAVTAGPELQLTNATGTNVNCGELALNFGTQPVGVTSDAVFTIKNTGTAALTVTSISLSNTTDFTVVSPSTFPLSVGSSGSTIVLVRFNAATSGSKTGTLTINNNDTNEGSCVVNLTGTAIEPCTAPVVADGEVDFDNLTPFSVNSLVAFGDADAYIAVISTSATLGAVPADGVSYNVGNAIGTGTVAYKGNLTNVSLSGLNEETTYYVFVFPYNSVACTGGPLYFTTESITSTFTTPDAPCVGGNETFANMGTNSSTYTNRTWTGDNGWQWNATDSRNDQTLNSKAITLRNGTLKNVVPVNGGIGALSFTYKRVFNDNSTLKVLVNGLQCGGDITVSSETPATFIQDIDVNGPVTIELVNSGNRTVIDDLTWNCYSLPDRPEIQLFDEEGAEKACGDFLIDFNTVAVNAPYEVLFTIKNEGTQDLVITSLNLSDVVNYGVSSSFPLPATIPYLGTLDVTVFLDAPATGVFPATLTIVSNDSTEGSCVVNLTAKVQNVCAVPDTATASATVSNQTSGSFDVTVTGTSANNYVAFYTSTGTITPPVTGSVYVAGQIVGDAIVGYVGSNASFTIQNLDPETIYTVHVYPYNSVECVDGPAYSDASIATTGTTTEFICAAGSETFTNVGTASSSYGTKTWIGDNNISWTATDARNDQTENGKAIALRIGSLKNNNVILGGIGTLTFKYKKVFTGNSTLKVLVNGVQQGTDITVSADTATTFSYAVNISADATIELVNSGMRTVIDDITWNCYSGSSARTALAKNKTANTIAIEPVLYPNPNNGQFQLDLISDNADVIVYDVTGKIVLRKTISDNEMIDLSNAGKGIYMVQITSGTTVTNKKVIIK